MPTQANGQVLPPAPTIDIPEIQEQKGSALDAAAAKTLSSNAEAAQAAKLMGAGQKGSARSKRKRGGGAPSLNVSPPNLPEAGTIPGVSAAGVQAKLIDVANQAKADAMYDKLGNATPYDPSKGGRRTKRHRRTNGRRSNRTHRRRNRKSSNRSRRSRISVLKHVARTK